MARTTGKRASVWGLAAPWGCAVTAVCLAQLALSRAAEVPKANEESCANEGSCANEEAVPEANKEESCANEETCASNFMLQKRQKMLDAALEQPRKEGSDAWADEDEEEGADLPAEEIKLLEVAEGTNKLEAHGLSHSGAAVRAVDPCACAAKIPTVRNAVINNLGGLGPGTGEPVIRISPYLKLSNGRSVDLTISNLSEYKANDVDRNGVVGNFTQVNIKKGFVDLLFEFSDTETRAGVVMPPIFMTVYDIDGPENNVLAESVEIESSDITSYELSNNTEVADSEKGNRTVFSSTAFGVQCDNPTSIEELGTVSCDPDVGPVDQFARAVAVSMKGGVTNYRVTLRAGKGVKGRNFLFAAPAYFSHFCLEKPDTVLDPCACAAKMPSVRAAITNNLGGLGPETGEHVIKLSPYLMLADGRYVDLTISNLSEYKANNVNRNGVVGNFTQVNIKEGFVDLLFRFSDTATGEGVAMSPFNMTVYDIDGPEKNVFAESVEIETSDITSHERSSNTQVVDSEVGSRTVFSSTAFGVQCDNPTSIEELGTVSCDPDVGPVDQVARAVAVSMKGGVSDYRVTVRAGAKTKGRNFLFAAPAFLNHVCKELPDSQGVPDQACLTTGIGGVGPGHACVFPFRKGKREFQGCTYTGKKFLWCATEVDGEGKMKKWGYCPHSSVCRHVDSNL